MTDVNLSFYGWNIMAEKEIRNFAIQDEKGNKIEVFMGRTLRQAAPERRPRPEGAGVQPQMRAGLDTRQ